MNVTLNWQRRFKFRVSADKPIKGRLCPLLAYRLFGAGRFESAMPVRCNIIVGDIPFPISHDSPMIFPLYVNVTLFFVAG